MKPIKTIVTIKRDYDTNTSRHRRLEDIKELTPKGCEIYAIQDNRHIEIEGVEYVRDKEELPKGCEDVEAVWYSQGDSETFRIKGGDEAIREHMKKLYTHQNDYIATAEEVTAEGRTRPVDLDYPSFCMNDTEFPTENEVCSEFASLNELEGEVEYICELF